MKICAERQKLLDCNGHALVTGGPGSGKTTIALKKALLCIQQGLLPGQSILFLSFSRAAVARVVEASRLQLDKDGRKLLNVQTFHSFFWELLKTHSYLLGTPRPIRILMPQDERVRNEGARGDKDEKKWAAWLKERERLFAEEGLVAFDLFAPKAAALLEESVLIRRLLAERFPVIIVDEAQDTGPDAWRCIELLAPLVRVICLADLEQQIFDHLPGIGPERIDAIKAALHPIEVELGSENMRSPGSEIADFGRDILSGKAKAGGYKGVSSLAFNRATPLGPTLRRALGLLKRAVRKDAERWPKTIAILVPSGIEAAKVSVGLNSGEKPVAHKLMFDEDEARLAARFAAFLLEPRDGIIEVKQVVEALMLLADVKRASGSNTTVKQLVAWATKCLAGTISAAGQVRALRIVLSALTTNAFSGNPANDWILVKQTLRASGDSLLIQVAQHLDYLVAFNRGKRISANLSTAWSATGTYLRARDALDSALTQDLILDGLDDPDGIQVMTVHKAKGKQFDGVLVLRRETHNGQTMVSNLVWRGDKTPYRRSRKILMVAVTRAKVHTLMVQQVWPGCPIMDAYNLQSAYDV
ncbi:UvrD-helicase domain-containing protein [Granulicella mallensis]|uniref:DNA helicase-2/ATP-dependent DNA helicase PcrA n=1 Tax=Granulicella mallensis TaxID=940614 RepID=A0A7W7ZTC2_9BACT|nr:UvrD-helicase domain-containing protein [Granulicella mallensis]MBB5064916.1 DNA helicase-2/ATP-dependent DNA helicase PcrA [Granulicella mallensis]